MTTRSVRWFAAAIAALVLVASVVWAPSAFPKLQLCMFRRYTGLSCPGCGMTRAFCALGHGEWSAAWSFHPFGYPLYALTIAIVAWPFVARAKPELERRVVDSRATMALSIAIVTGMLAFGVVRAWLEWRAR